MVFCGQSGRTEGYTFTGPSYRYLAAAFSCRQGKASLPDGGGHRKGRTNLSKPEETKNTGCQESLRRNYEIEYVQKVDALYIRILGKSVAYPREVEEGINLGFGETVKMIGFEVIGAAA